MDNESTCRYVALLVSHKHILDLFRRIVPPVKTKPQVSLQWDHGWQLSKHSSRVQAVRQLPSFMQVQVKSFRQVSEGYWNLFSHPGVYLHRHIRAILKFQRNTCPPYIVVDYSFKVKLKREILSRKVNSYFKRKCSENL